MTAASVSRPDAWASPQAETTHIALVGAAGDAIVQVIPWSIEIEDIETLSRVGIWEHEKALQPLRITISMRGVAPAFPRTIDDCIDYEPVCRWIVEEWPDRPHTALLETRLREVIDFIFDIDRRIEWVSVEILKSHAIREARGVGVCVAMSRILYESLGRDRAAA